MSVAGPNRLLAYVSVTDTVRSGTGSVADLRAAVHRDPRAVAFSAAALAAAADTRGDRHELSAALSVLGRARRSLGEIDLAETDLLAAIEAAGADPELAADAMIGLAGVLSYAGRTTEAYERLDTAERLASPELVTYVHLQRAILRQRAGHTAEALAGYEAALPGLRAAGARVDVALVLMNRGVIRTRNGRCDDAIADLSEALRLFTADGHRFGAAQACHGLGWANTRRGDLPRALEQLDEASECFRRLGHEALEVDVDRVEVLLAAGLAAEAGALAVDLAGRQTAAGNHSKAAEAWLLSAHAARLGGDRARSARHAERARALYARQGCPGGELAARLGVLQAGADAAAAGELGRLADDLERAGNERGRATALALACVRACDAGDAAQAARLAARCTGPATAPGVFEVRAQSRYALAREAELRGDGTAARRHVRTGLADLHRHRSGLGAGDARASVARHAADLSALGLRLALRTGSPAAVWEAMELARAGRTPGPARPPADGPLAAELTELRASAARLRAAEEAGHDTTDLVRRHAELERSVHRRRLRAPGPGRARRFAPPPLDRVTGALGGSTLLELAGIDGRAVGVVLGPGPARVADLGPAAVLDDLSRTVTATLHRSVTRPGGPAPLLARALAALDELVAGALAGDGPAVLVVPPALHTLPWHLLPCLAGRPVAVAPSAGWWLRAAEQPPGRPPGQPLGQPVSVVAGPRLAEAVREAHQVAAAQPGARVLTGPAATVPAVKAALASSRLTHVASHCRIRHDNPLWSSLELADGPLFVHDLEELPRTSPVVVLSGCHTGVGVRAGDDLLGLAGALLARGTRSLVAAVCELPDTAATRETMTALHRSLAAGASPAAALAALSARGRGEETLLAAALTCFGTH